MGTGFSVNKLSPRKRRRLRDYLKRYPKSYLIDKYISLLEAYQDQLLSRVDVWEIGEADIRCFKEALERDIKEMCKNDRCKQLNRQRILTLEEVLRVFCLKFSHVWGDPEAKYLYYENYNPYDAFDGMPQVFAARAVETSERGSV